MFQVQGEAAVVLVVVDAVICFFVCYSFAEHLKFNMH